VFSSADAGQSIAGIPISFAAHLIDYVLKLTESKEVVKGAAVSVVKTIGTFECEPAWNIDPLAGVIGVQY
jgi:hypothetical protein